MTNLPPTGPSDSHPGSSEILDAGSGSAIVERNGGGAKRGLLLGGGVLGLALVGGGAWAAMSFLSTGAQPAEALPAGALGYVSIDLDPSGGQKIEAVRTLNKFPAFKDSVGISPDEDLRKTIFEDALEGQDCGVTYADDVEPWLGERAAVAAVPGDDGADTVAVVQVTDAGAADAGLKALAACGGEADAQTGWVIDGDWAVIASSQQVADAVGADAADASLADDADFQRWTGETGDAGVVTMYAAPDAAAAFLDEVGTDAPAGAADQLRDFQGAAATIRFDDGALELEGAGQVGSQLSDALGSGDVASSVDGLPDDTAAVLGISLGDDWFDQALSAFAGGLGGDADSLIAQVESSTGLQIPEDIETLTDGGLVVAVGAGLDPEAIINSADPSGVPVAIKLTGDADEIQAVIAKLQGAVPGGAQIIGTSVEGDTVVVGPDSPFREEVAQGGSLGDSDTFTSVVPNADSPGVLYVDVNAFDAALESLGGGDQQVMENVKPLRAIGVSSTLDGDVTRFNLRVSTD